jgi:hypothetical protein
MNKMNTFLSWYYSIPSQKRLLVDQFILWGFGFVGAVSIVVTLIIVNN